MSHESSIRRIFDGPELIAKFLRGRQTAQEEKDLLAWLLATKENQRLYIEICGAHDERNPWIDDRSPDINYVIHQLRINISTSRDEGIY